MANGNESCNRTRLSDRNRTGTGAYVGFGLWDRENLPKTSKNDGARESRITSSPLR